MKEEVEYVWIRKLSVTSVLLLSVRWVMVLFQVVPYIDETSIKDKLLDIIGLIVSDYNRRRYINFL